MEMAGMLTVLALLGAAWYTSESASISQTLPQAVHLQQQQQQQHHSGSPDECISFLLNHLPDMDKGVLSNDTLQLNVDLALAARSAFKWSRAVPWDLFLNYVLPHANMDEPRDDWRGVMVKKLAPIVSDARAQSISEAVHLINQEVWNIWGIVFKAGQTPEIMSPSQVIAAGYASCTGLSIFLVDALRSVGIPARVTGTPDWKRPVSSVGRSGQSNHHDLEKSDQINNHNWVEFWDSGSWSFIGAAEDDPNGFNRTWFFPKPAEHQIPGSKMHAIYAVSYAPTEHNVKYPLIWHDGWFVNAEDVTQNYIDEAHRVDDKTGHTYAITARTHTSTTH